MPADPQTLTEHELYWLQRLRDAIAALEQGGICRVDMDCIAESEVVTIKRMLGVLQDFAHGYSEHDPDQPRLSAAFQKALTAISDQQFTASRERAAPVAAARAPQPADEPDIVLNGVEISLLAALLRSHRLHSDHCIPNDALQKKLLPLERAVVRLKLKPESAAACEQPEPPEDTTSWHVCHTCDGKGIHP